MNEPERTGDWEKEKEEAWREIALRIETNYTDWPWVRASIYALLVTARAEERARIREKLEGMRKNEGPLQNGYNAALSDALTVVDEEV